jgi:hypothetical protein
VTLRDGPVPVNNGLVDGSPGSPTTRLCRAARTGMQAADLFEQGVIPADVARQGCLAPDRV